MSGVEIITVRGQHYNICHLFIILIDYLLQRTRGLESSLGKYIRKVFFN